MGLLAKALPRGESASVQNTVQSPKGVYRAFFVGITDPVERVSEWNDKCRLCKGTGNGYGDEPQGCRVCHGTGKRTEQKVKILYSLENGVVEQEEVNFKLAGPGTATAGQKRKKVQYETWSSTRPDPASGALPGRCRQWFGGDLHRFGPGTASRRTRRAGLPMPSCARRTR